MATGEEVWAQAWSEPEAGTDLASLRSTATKTDGGWLLNGQKTWCSRAAFGERAFGLFRSDPEAERHRGLTYFLFPLDADGVTVRPIAQLDGEAGFAEIFLEDVFVPDTDVLGGAGRRLAGRDEHVGNERGMSLRCPARFLRGGRPARRPVESQSPSRGLRRSGGRRLDQGAGLPALHVRHGDAAGRRAASSAPSRR